MAMYIDLVSSSPVPSRPRGSPGAIISTLNERPLVNSSPVAANVRKVASVGEARDDLEVDLDFPEPRLVKRRKVSPSIGADATKPERLSLPGSLQEPISLSEDEVLPTLGVERDVVVGTRFMASTHISRLDFSDAIEFSSSAPESRTRKATFADVMDLSEEFDLPEDIFTDLFPSRSQPLAVSSSRNALSERTTNVLATLDKKRTKASAEVKHNNAASRIESKTKSFAVLREVEDLDEILDSSPEEPVRAKALKPPRLNEGERAAKAVERAAAKAAKEADRHAEKERKRAEKEEKAREKQRAADIAEVNKSKIDKKNSIHEMIVDMSRALQGTSIGNQVEEFMKIMQVDVSYIEDEMDLSGGDDREIAGNIIRWRRRIDGDYDAELDHFTPLAEQRIDHEKHLIVHLTGVEFCALVSRQTDGVCAHISEAAMKHNIDAHVQILQCRYKGCKPIYLIEGLTSFLKKNKNAKNREFQAAARAADLDVENSVASTTGQRPRRRKQHKATTQDLSFFTPDITDALLLHNQLTHPTVLIHHSANPSSSAHWIKTFTESLSTRPYRLLKNAFNDSHAGFCMDTGQVKTGENAEDTYLRMLQELPRVTSSMAHGVRDSGYSTVRELVEGFQKEGRLMLADVRKAMNKDGGVSDRRLGPAVSKRLYKVFFGNDPESMDV